MTTPSPVSLTYLPLSSSPTLTELRAFVAAIPDENWCIGTSSRRDPRHCLLSHLWFAAGSPERVTDYGLKEPAISQAVAALFTPLTRTDSPHAGHGGFGAITDVNDAKDSRYSQPTVRDRLLAAIDDLIAGTIPSLPSTTATP